VFGRGFLRRRARDGRRWRPNGVAMFVANRDAVRAKFAEQPSVLKKSLSARSAVQESPKTRLKHYKYGVFSP
jgi:hypothetical protein